MYCCYSTGVRETESGTVTTEVLDADNLSP